MTQSANIDPAERARFDALAERWWDPEGDMRPLHDLNPARLDYIRQRAELKDSKVLDVGCGGGILSESMAQAGAEVSGIDIAERSLKIARLHQLESGLSVNYQLTTVEDLLAEQGADQFDTVTCLEMLEHVPAPDQVVAACAELVRPGGDLFFSTINRNLASYALAIVGAEYIMRLLPRGTHDYQKLIRPSELSSWCRHAGLNVNDISGLAYNPLTHTAAVGGPVTVNYLLHARKPG